MREADGREVRVGLGSVATQLDWAKARVGGGCGALRGVPAHHAGSRLDLFFASSAALMNLLDRYGRDTRSKPRNSQSQEQEDTCLWGRALCLLVSV
jgi:hypothetical protein